MICILISARSLFKVLKPFIAFVISGYFRLFPFTLYKYTLEPFSSVFALFQINTRFNTDYSRRIVHTLSALFDALAKHHPISAIKSIVFPFILSRPIGTTLAWFSSVFAPFYACTQFVEHITAQSQDSILNRTFQFTPYTANTALLSAVPYSPGRFLCSCALLPYRFLKCGLSDAPPGTDHLTGSWQPLPCL